MNDLAKLFSEGAVNAGLSPPVEDGAAVEVDWSIGSGGITSLGGKVIWPPKSSPPQSWIRIEPRTLMFFDLETRAPIRNQTEPTHPRPGRQVAREPASRAATLSLGGADPGPTPSIERQHHLCLQTESGVGRIHRYQTVTVYVFHTTLAIELDDQETRVVRRTTTMPVINIKSTRPRSGPLVS